MYNVHVHISHCTMYIIHVASYRQPLPSACIVIYIYVCVLDVLCVCSDIVDD